jgi:hypothetical protein
MTSGKLDSWLLRGALALGTWLVAAPALAQTWVSPRTTPSLLELFAIDATGEDGWLYGAEDVAGDGLENFKQQEKNIDIRTAYAAADATDFWVRTYVSDTAGPGGNVTIYVFIDSDNNASTGGSAAATTINALFTTDTSPGGYEYVVALKGNGSVVGLWKWDGAAFAVESFTPTQIVPEVGTDLDPIKVNDNVHGYIQGKIALSLVGLTAQCNANLYVRSAIDTGGLGNGDLEVGQIGACSPAGNDQNANGIPDPLEETKKDCSSDDQCAGDGICQNGKCIFPMPCIDDPDCTLPGYVCTTDGRCVPGGGGSCSTNADCQNDLVCVGGNCVACTPGGAQCGTGKECGPNGRCVVDIPPSAPCTTNENCTDGRVCINGTCGDCTPGGLQCGPGVQCGPDGRCGGIAPNDGDEQGGQEVQGGACACSLPGSANTPAWLLLLALPTALAARRIRRRRSL